MSESRKAPTVASLLVFVLLAAVALAYDLPFHHTPGERHVISRHAHAGAVTTCWSDGVCQTYLDGISAASLDAMLADLRRQRRTYPGSGTCHAGIDQ